MSRLSRHGRKWGVGLGSLAFAGLGLQACGPSVQFIYEGDIRFEHCYRLDFDERIVSSHRKACWEDWSLRYPKGQTRDRLEYAERRIKALAAGEQGALSLKTAKSSDAGLPPFTGEPAQVPTHTEVPPSSSAARPGDKQ